MTGTAPPSPFFAPSTPQVTVEHRTPGGTKRQVQQRTEVEEKKSTILGTAGNLINAIVGSGIVGIPYAIKQSGFVAGIFLIILCAFLTEKSLRLLVATAKHVHCPSYETAAEAPFGVAGFRFVAINMLIMAYGAMLSYLMIVKESFSALFGIEPDNLPVRRAILVVISLAVQLPLSSKRDMADLAFTSRLSVLIDTFLVFFVAFNAPIVESLENVGGIGNLLKEDSINYDTVFVGLGVLSFAFVCQHSAFIIAGSLERPTISRWSIVTRSALLFCGILAMLCGTTGYLGFLDDTRGNILGNLPSDSWTANAARSMLGCTMLFVYPLESFVARHVCVVLLFAGRRAHDGDDSTILNRRDRRIGLTFILYLTAVIPAAIFEDLGPVLAISGAIGGSSLSYIGPGLVYLGVHGQRFMDLVGESWFGSLVKPKQLKSIPEHDDVDPEEHSPLLNGAKASRSREEGDSFMIHSLKWTMWCLSGMPLWYHLAFLGKQGLDRHAREMALKSPHPIRIGDVEYMREESTAVVKGTIDSPGLVMSPENGRDLIRHNSFGATRPKGLPPSPNPAMLRQAEGRPGVGINQLLGKELLRKQQMEKAKILVIEKDPQEAPAGWYDFAVAIFYILFGLVALFAGVLSLSAEDDEGETVHGVNRF